MTARNRQTTRRTPVATPQIGPAYSRRLLILILAFICSGLAGPGVIANSVAQSNQDVRFAFWGDPAEEAAYQLVIDRFEADHPGIEVTADYTPGQSDYYRKLTTDFAAGDPPDVFLTNYRQFGQYAAADSLFPVQPFLNTSDALAESDFYPLALDAFRFGSGDLYCLPQNISSLVVYYNVDMFNAAGIPLPADGWSWEAFTDAASQLTQDTDGDGNIDQFGVVVEPSMYRMASFVWGAGGEIVDDLEQPSTLTIDTPEAQLGLERFISLGVDGINVVPSEEEVAAEADQDRFMRGGAAMFLQSRRPVPTLREIRDFTWDVAPLPVLSEPATVLHSDAFCMTSERGATWDFIEFAGSETGQQIMAETGRTVPSMISVSVSDVFLDGNPIPQEGVQVNSEEGAPPENSQVYLDNIENMHRLPNISTWVEIEDIFDAEFGRSFYIENFDIEAAAKSATDKSLEVFARASTPS